MVNPEVDIFKLLCPQCHKPMVSHSTEKSLLCTYLMTATMFNMKMLEKLKERGGTSDTDETYDYDKFGK